MGNKYWIKANSNHLHGSFNHTYKPILTIQSGDQVEYTTVDIGWGYNDKNGERTEYTSREKEEYWGHPIIGPIAIEEAKPGFTLEIKINDLIPGWYGWNCAGGKDNWHNNKLGLTQSKEIRLDWNVDREKMIATTVRNNKSFSVSINPFMGVMATAPKEVGMHSTIPPRYCGGNIDCKELVKGSSLFLPIVVEGGLFSVGDGHAAQGDGEVSGQAIECPMDVVDLTFIVHKDLSLKMPRAKTPTGWVTFGFHEDLNEATVMALDEMIALIQQLYDVDKVEATALASVSVDLRITQIVNQVKGVHAILPNGVLR
ncbi:acetamidase/formamidase family protein [Halalkalibacter akibai]|uniref:Acetamidase n=1 Tax=Halalkalibacter akibai (strain ATCC 43226 / DSM 21942 / CIP 109018 / JCM 9157 / 1139) TaxID=1236973 RepID=W4QZY8_HALA3|nr:acetamidase/formamidase family protein [Halalkalibacter akibai]GAE37233.1 hypothetical protein JCM9157_4501 [Halalkalibacter akibai JCM 9157]